MTGRDETELERWDRNFTELLQEVRVAQTGVQILFAFLLILPFSARFERADRLGTVVYVVTLIVSAAATALLIAPVSYHRQVFRQGRKPELVGTASTLAKLGLGALVVAITGSVFLVLNVVAGLGWAIALAGAVAILHTSLWYVLPTTSRGRRGAGNP